MNTSKLLIVAPLVTLSLFGCSSEPEPQTASTEVSAVSTSTAPDISHSFGETVTIPETNGLGEYGVADYTVSAPYRDQGYAGVDLSIVTTEGQQYIPGTVMALTSAGQKIEALDKDFNLTGQFDFSGSMVAGESRSGKVLFDTPDQIKKVILYHGTISPPVAEWSE